MRIGDWSSDECSSDLHPRARLGGLERDIAFVLADRRIALRLRDDHQALGQHLQIGARHRAHPEAIVAISEHAHPLGRAAVGRSEEHTSELQSLMRISYAVFCLKKKKTKQES